MIRTRVGYCGGTTPHPTYHAIGDHAETVEIDFDPSVISFEQLLAWFWVAHDPVRPSFSDQYRSAIFCRGEEQLHLARASKEREEGRRGRRLYTEIAPAGLFTRAEDYHQKYLVRREPEILEEFAVIYPDSREFTDSTAVARVNGFLGGFGTASALERDLPLLGLSSRGDQILRRKVTRSAAGGSLA